MSLSCLNPVVWLKYNPCSNNYLLEAGYNRIGSGNFGNVTGDHAFIVRHTWSADENRSQFQLTAFYLAQENRWRRADLTLLQTCYSREEIDGALESAGFIDLGYHDALDAGMATHLGDRAFFVAHKSRSEE